MISGPSIKEMMICWTNPGQNFSNWETRGHAALVPWPDERGRGDIFFKTSGACDLHIHDFNRVQLQHFVLSTAIGMIIGDGMAPDVVHRALWPLIEYRAALPPDIPAPPGEERYGRFAADSD